MATTDETLLVPCPECGELSPEPMDRVAANDVIPCSLCGGLIDLVVDECRPLVEQAKAHMANRQGQSRSSRPA